MDVEVIADRLLERIKATLTEYATSGRNEARIDLVIRYHDQLDGLFSRELDIIIDLIHRQLGRATGLRVERRAHTICCEW